MAGGVLRVSGSMINWGYGGREIGSGVTVSFFPSQFFPRGKTDRSVFSPGERFD